MKQIFKEPLFHFLLLGAALFGGYSLLNRNAAVEQDEIILTPGQIETLSATFAKIWQRPPSPDELKGQIDEYVKEEILSREAIKLGLDQRDTVIRRRLRQKMEFLAEDFAAAAEPTEAELAEFLAKHPERFLEEAHYTVRQIYLNPELHATSLQQDVAELLGDLKEHGADVDLAAHGDSTLLPGELINEPERAVEAQFGQAFASALATAKTNQWTGPVESAYGVHLVFISERAEGRAPVLAEVRDAVKRELMNERRLAANHRYVEELLKKYRVTIEWPKTDPHSSSNATAMNR